MGAPDTVRILAFGRAADILGWASRELALDNGRTVGCMLAGLERNRPALAEARDRLRFAVNQQYATLDTPLEPGDELALIPPVAGG